MRHTNGESMLLEVMPETTGKELKQQIKERKPWDELARSTTSAEIVLEDNQLLANDAKVLEAAITEDTVVSVVFKPNKVICSNKDAIVSLGGIVDSELLLVVEIPDDDTQIHENAFEGCHTLAKVTIPDSVTYIGKGAFAVCRSLVTVTIPNSVTHIGNFAFVNCSSLVNVTIPDSVTHIGDWAFARCRSLVSVIIPDSVTHIGGGAFHGCRLLVNSVEHIGQVPLKRVEMQSADATAEDGM